MAERGPHHRVMERVTWETNAFDQSTASTNRYTELETGMHFLRHGQWVESRAEIELTAEGATTKNIQHPVAFAPDLNRVGAVDLTLPDGRHLRSRVVGLAYFDTSSGESVLIAQTRNTTGLLFEPNQVIYTNTFTGDSGVSADVQYIVMKAGLRQNILIHALPAPEAFQLNPATVVLQCLTEFFDAPVPELRTSAMTLDGLGDETVDFSSMSMPRGKAFAIGEPDADARAIPVFKQWVVLENGRTFLVEQIPVAAVRAQLERLPASRGGAGVNPRRSGAGKSMMAALEAVLPEAMETAALAPVRMARLDSWSPRGFLLDYSLVSSTNDFTFKADTTYLVNGFVNLSGTTRIEGGTVVKFTNSATAQLYFSGSLDCQTGPYRPAIFTVKDDNTVGETISGSTGNPTNAYGSGLLVTTDGNTLKHARFSHLFWAVDFSTLGAATLNLAHVQFVKCRYPLQASQFSCFLSCGATVNLDNALAYGCDDFFQGDYGILRARHLTVNQCNTLGSDSGNDSKLYLTNSLLVAVTNWGNMPYTNNSTVYYATNPGGIFQTNGAASHYLANNSTNRNAGTTNLSAPLLAALKTTTTYPPVEITTNITAATTLSLRAARDTDTPDLGYHYDPLDYVVSGRTVSGALTLTNGVALGTYGGSSVYGLRLSSGGGFLAEGSPNRLNWMARYHTVQEQSSTNWSAGTAGGSVTLLSSVPVNVRFTGWSALGGTGKHFFDNTDGTTPVAFSHSYFGGGQFTIDPGAVALTNCVWDRVYASLQDNFDSGRKWYLFNNLFFGGTLYYRAKGDDPLLLAYDNFFDRTVITKGISSASFTHDYNGYITNQNRLTPNGTHDVLLTNLPVYLTGPLGRFYYPTNDGKLSRLREAGSRLADLAGLYHFTTLTNQVKEGNTTNDIGFHYVSAYADGTPVDSNTNGVPDYKDSLDNCDSDGDGIPDGWELAHNLNPLVNNASDDPDGDDLTNLQEYLANSNPHSVLVVAWGDNSAGQCNVPAGLGDVIGIAAAEDFSLALRKNGTVVAWGGNAYGQTTVPAGLTNVTRISANWYDAGALRNDGTVARWGASLHSVPSSATNLTAMSVGYDYVMGIQSNGTLISWGQSAWPSYRASILPSLTNVTAVATATDHKVAILPGSVMAWGANGSGQLDRPVAVQDVISVAAGYNHSLAVRENSTVLAWGANPFGETNVPVALTNIIAVAGGTNHSVALKENGTVVAWGRNNYAQTNVPAGLTNVTAIAAHANQTLALRSNGNVTNWGNTFGGVPASLTNAIAIAAGADFCLALRSNSTVAAWGSNGSGQTNVPSGLTNVVSIAAGSYHALALKENGTVVAWGANGSGQTNVPAGLSNVMAVAAGATHSAALKNDGTFVCWGNNAENQTNAPTAHPPAKYIAAGGNHTLAAIFSPLTQYQVDVSKDLLLIYNTNSVNSKIVKDYYLARRPMVGGANTLGISCTNHEVVSTTDFTNQILSSVLNWLAANPTKRPQYLILFPDLPSRTWKTSGGVFIQQADSVAYGLHEGFPGIKPFVTSINMGLCYGTNVCAALTNDCIGYINKLEYFGTNYSPGRLFISASAGGYGNTNFAVDDVFHGDPNSPTLVRDATNGLISAGVPLSAILYIHDNEPCLGTNQLGLCTNYQAKPHLTNAVDLAGYICWGAHSTLGNEYPINGAVKWSGRSSWWVIQTIESFNGWRSTGQGNFTQWFSPYAFGGTNYLNTPVGAVTHTDEPGGPGVNNASVYFALWASGKSFPICAWNSRNTVYFQAVGDPFVKR